MYLEFYMYNLDNQLCFASKELNHNHWDKGRSFVEIYKKNFNTKIKKKNEKLKNKNWNKKKNKN